MCITEIWEYHECGCSCRRHLPCLNARAMIPDSGASSLPTFRSIDFATLINLGYTTIRPKSLGIYDRNYPSVDISTSSCSDSSDVNHIVRRQFLESICDDCLMRELMSEQSSESASSHENRNESPGDYHTRRLDSRTQLVCEGETCPTSTCNSSMSTTIIPLSKGCNNESPQTDQSVDREAWSPTVSPKNSSRGMIASHQHQTRKHDHIKDLRRRGIDLSRDELRISSRWSSGEQRSMKNFRDALKEAARDESESAFSKFVKKETANHVANLRNVKSVVTGMRRSVSVANFKTGLSRSRSMLKLKSSPTNAMNTFPGERAFRLTSRHQALRDQYYADEKRQQRHSLAPQKATHSSGHPKRRSTLICSTGASLGEADMVVENGDNSTEHSKDLCETSSWEQHLQHDLAQRQSARKAIGLAKPDPQQHTGSGLRHVQALSHSKASTHFIGSDVCSSSPVQRHRRLRTSDTVSSSSTASCLPSPGERLDGVIDTDALDDSDEQQVMNVLKDWPDQYTRLVSAWSASTALDNDQQEDQDEWSTRLMRPEGLSDSSAARHEPQSPDTVPPSGCDWSEASSSRHSGYQAHIKSERNSWMRLGDVAESYAEDTGDKTKSFAIAE